MAARQRSSPTSSSDCLKMLGLLRKEGLRMKRGALSGRISVALCGISFIIAATILRDFIWIQFPTQSQSPRARRKEWSNPIGPSRRDLSMNLGGGNCKWQPPSYEVPDDIEFYKTIIAGYPSGDKRMIFIQMEGLTGWPARDEWAFEYSGMTNHPFIKSNYPHHEGIWGWQDAGDQVVMMVRNIRRSMVEYHDILWDIGYATTYDVALASLDNLYRNRPPKEDFLVWRDERVLDECYWYGWFIDYWMEGGLMRDMFTHKITTPEHWNMLMIPFGYPKDKVAYDVVVGNDTVVTPSYDPHCLNDVSGGCEPVAVISAEKLFDYAEGPAETTKIAQALMSNTKMSQHVIDQEAWDCIWDELIVKGKGARIVNDRPGVGGEQEYNFSAEMLEGMLQELDRLIDKYSAVEWNQKPTAVRLVEILTWHRGTIQTELDEVNTGVRKLLDSDFLGPKERERRRQLQLKESGSKSTEEKKNKDYSPYFKALDEKIRDQRVQSKRNEAIVTGRIG